MCTELLEQVPNVSHRTSLPTRHTRCEPQPVLPNKASWMPRPRRRRSTSKARSAFTRPKLRASRQGKLLPERAFPSRDDARSPPRRTGLANLERQRPGPDWRHSSLAAAIGMLARRCRRGLLKHPRGPGQPLPPPRRAGHRKWRPKCQAEGCPKAAAAHFLCDQAGGQSRARSYSGKGILETN